MWHVDPGGERPDRAAVERWRRRTSPPGHEIPVDVAVTPVVVRTDDLAVAVGELRVFTTGLTIGVAVRTRNRPAGRATADLHRAVMGHPAPGENDGSRLLLGLELADGTRVSTLAGRPSPGDVTDAPLLVPTGGGGGANGAIDARFWLSPLPPDGPLTVVLAWPSSGLTETRHTWDGLALTSAAAGVVTLWPPDPPPAPRPPAPPTVPPGSWFGG